jgi:pimeloyl-ACP methyl ester carboxylesterase
MTILAVRGAGTLSGGAALDQPRPDSWAQVDDTARLSAADRRAQVAAGPLVPEGVVPVVLLHAFPLHSAMWDPMLAQLPELPVLTIDLPGAGLSPVIDPVSIRAAGLAVIETVRAVGAERAVIGGISMGGYVAMSIIRDAPELVAGLVLMHTKTQADDPPVRASRLETARRVLAEGSPESLRPMAARMVSAASKAAQPGLVEQIEHWIDQATPGGIAWAEEAMAGRDDSMAVMRACGLPTTVMTGEDDPFVTVDQADEIVDAVGFKANLIILSGVGHLGPLECPYAAARTLRECYRRMAE